MEDNSFHTKSIIGLKREQAEKYLDEKGIDYRHIKPGYAYTCDWCPTRVNFYTDENDIITEADNG